MDKNKKKQQEEVEVIEESGELVAERIEELAQEEKEKATKELSEIQKLQEKLKDCQEKYLRIAADYQNLEKRSREERSEWMKSSGKHILLKMLPVLDTLLMASKHSKDQNLLVSIAQFMDALKAEGVTRISTENKKFDPLIMECIQTIVGKEGEVMEEVRAGFMLHDKLLRVAEVVVGKKKE